MQASERLIDCIVNIDQHPFWHPFWDGHNYDWKGGGRRYGRECFEALLYLHRAVPLRDCKPRDLLDEVRVAVVAAHVPGLEPAGNRRGRLPARRVDLVAPYIAHHKSPYKPAKSNIKGSMQCADRIIQEFSRT